MVMELWEGETLVVLKVAVKPLLQSCPMEMRALVAERAPLVSGRGDAMRLERRRQNSGDRQGDGDSDGGGAGFPWRRC